MTQNPILTTKILWSVLNNYLPCMKRNWLLWSWAFAFYGAAIVSYWVLSPIYLKWIIDEVATSPTRELSSVLLYLVYLSLTDLCGQVFYRIADFSFMKAQIIGIGFLSEKAFKSVTDKSYGFFADNFVGGLVSKAKRYTNSFELLTDVFVMNIWMDLIKVVLMSVVLMQIDRLLGVLFFLWAVIFSIVSFFMFRIKIKYDMDSSSADSTVTALFADVFANILTVKSFGKENFEHKNFGDAVEDRKLKMSKAWNFQNVQWMIQGLLVFILEIGFLYYGLLLWNEGRLSAGDIVLLQTYIFVIGRSLWDLGRAISRMNRALVEAHEMVEILETKPEIADCDRPLEFVCNRGEVGFRNVNFSYKDASSEVLSEFNLEIKAGEKVGLVGLSGAGKSTITKLILRFVDPDSGCIEIDGVDISKIRQADLRSAISYVAQESVLFHRSLRENLTYARSDISEEELGEILRSANLTEMVSNLPQGLETFVGERGVKLSGGERQRVAIARAMIENAHILVLDEATSSLDSRSEKLIQDALTKLLEKKTALVIAHRLSTLTRMDRIIFLEQGKIIESGSHAELLAQNGNYAKLWEHQSGGFLLED
jgi:ATP-binding cassette subfamily B protein